MKNLLLHEITHILAFHPFFFEHLGMSKVSGSMSYITSPKALEKAREHFGCDSLSEIPLENQGGIGTIGAHWESRYMLGDYMISTDYPDFAISDITLALFERGGWGRRSFRGRWSRSSSARQGRGRRGRTRGRGHRRPGGGCRRREGRSREGTPARYGTRWVPFSPRMAAARRWGWVMMTSFPPDLRKSTAAAILGPMLPAGNSPSAM